MGKISDISRLANNIARLATIPSQVSKLAAEKIDRLIQESFDKGEDPYGNRWRQLRPRTLRKHGPPPLTDTRHARLTYTVNPLQGAGIEIKFDAGYINHHQYGFHHVLGDYDVEARSLLPRGTFPRTWRQAIEDSTAEVLAGFR